MSKMASPVTGKPYGLAAVCRAWRIARSGIYRHRTPPLCQSSCRADKIGNFGGADSKQWLGTDRHTRTG
jgi:hypothetical protein